MSTVTEAALLGSPRRWKWTRDFYYGAIEAGLFDENDKVELLGGELVEEGMVDRMAPQSPEHASAVDLLGDALRAAFGSGFRVRVQSPLSLGLDSDPEPDVAVVRGSPSDYHHHHPAAAELVVEVSRNSAQFDRRVKAGLYASARIPEYWIVDLTAGVLEVHRDPEPAADVPFEAAYRTVHTLWAQDSVSPLGAPSAEIVVGGLLP